MLFVCHLVSNLLNMLWSTKMQGTQILSALFGSNQFNFETLTLCPSLQAKEGHEFLKVAVMALFLACTS